MARVELGKEQVYRDCLKCVFLDTPGQGILQLGKCIQLEWGIYTSAVINTFINSETIAPGNEGPRFGPGKVIVVTAVSTLDKGYIFKTRSGEVGDFCTLALQECVGANCCTEYQRSAVFECDTRLLDGSKYSLQRLCGPRWYLRGVPALGFGIHRNQIGKGATRVDTDMYHSLSSI